MNEKKELCDEKKFDPKFPVKTCGLVYCVIRFRDTEFAL